MRSLGKIHTPEAPDDARARESNNEAREEDSHDAPNGLAVPVVRGVVSKEELVLAELVWDPLRAVQGCDGVLLAVECTEEPGRYPERINEEENDGEGKHALVSLAVTASGKVRCEPRRRVFELHAVEDLRAEQGTPRVRERKLSSPLGGGGGGW